MKIGIDASRAFIEKRTGTEEYSQKLIKNLTILDTTSHQFFLYVRKLEKIDFQLPENFFIREIKRNKLWTQYGLAKEIRKNPVDILFVPAHSIPHKHPKNSIVTIHGLEYKHYPESYSLKERAFLEFNTLLNVKWSKKIIVPSESTKNDLMRYYKVDPEKIRVVYHGVSSIKYPVLDIKHRDKDSSNILFVGRLEKRKNLVNLIKAFNKFKNNNSINNKSCKLILVGKEGFGFEEIKLEIDRSFFRNDIIIKGYISEEEKVELYQKASLFVLISFYEGFGLPILEAMSHGLPVVCSDVSSLPEIAGGAGLLVNPSDIEEIARAFERIICNEDVKDDMIEKGFENVEKFSWEKCARETMNILLND